MPANPTTPTRRHVPRHENTVLVLQGGGALGAYQAGVYEAMHEAGLVPKWVTGVSIGAINAAIIAGNQPDDRVPQLRKFWDLVSAGFTFIAPSSLDPMRLAFNRVSTLAIATFGVPGFFQPRVPPPMIMPPGATATLSIYDTTPLRQTLLDMVDFELINSRGMRISIGAVDVQSGNSIYFDSRDPDLVLTPDHVMASGALPPGFPPVHIKDAWYWDGGLASNSPLWYVLDDQPDLSALIIQVDLFSARGKLPQTIDDVLERAKDILYSSKTRFNTTRAKEDEALRQALRHVIGKLPARLRKDENVKVLARHACERRVSIVHLINRSVAYSTVSKDYNFARTNIRASWEAGRADLRRTLANPDWRKAVNSRDGMRTFDMLR